MSRRSEYVSKARTFLTGVAAALLCSVIALLPNCGGGTSGTDSGGGSTRFFGTVLDSDNRPVQQAGVAIQESGDEGISDADGKFEFQSLVTTPKITLLVHSQTVQASTSLDIAEPNPAEVQVSLRLNQSSDSVQIVGSVIKPRPTPRPTARPKATRTPTPAPTPTVVPTPQVIRYLNLRIWFLHPRTTFDDEFFSSATVQVVGSSTPASAPRLIDGLFGYYSDLSIVSTSASDPISGDVRVRTRAGDFLIHYLNIASNIQHIGSGLSFHPALPYGELNQDPTSLTVEYTSLPSGTGAVEVTGP